MRDGRRVRRETDGERDVRQRRRASETKLGEKLLLSLSTTVVFILASLVSRSLRGGIVPIVANVRHKGKLDYNSEYSRSNNERALQ